MEWELKYSKVNLSIYQQAIKNNQPVPDFIKNKPEIKEKGLYFYLQAFFALETERNVGFAVSPIPILKIIEYGRYLGYKNETHLDNFVYVMRQLDNVALKYYNKQSSNENAKSTNAQVQKRNR